jgi:uncharacterized protein YdeI (YjbR/CyaY-like superfamily)
VRRAPCSRIIVVHPAEDLAMTTHDARIDAYIARAAPFARPILEHLRAAVHEACPGAEETLKWSAPHFMHGGRILAGMAAFKQHAAFAVPMLEAEGPGRGDAMGHYGRITALSDLPARRTLVAQLRKAARAIDDGAKLPRKRAAAKPPLPVPDAFTHALAQNAAAKRQFAAFPPGKQRDYVEWIAEARQVATRERRIAQAVEWIAEGKSRNWKYERR